MPFANVPKGALLLGLGLVLLLAGALPAAAARIPKCTEDCGESSCGFSCDMTKPCGDGVGGLALAGSCPAGSLCKVSAVWPAAVVGLAGPAALCNRALTALPLTTPALRKKPFPHTTPELTSCHNLCVHPCRRVAVSARAFQPPLSLPPAATPSVASPAAVSSATARCGQQGPSRFCLPTSRTCAALPPCTLCLAPGRLTQRPRGLRHADHLQVTCGDGMGGLVAPGLCPASFYCTVRPLLPRTTLLLPRTTLRAGCSWWHFRLQLAPPPPRHLPPPSS